MEDSRGGLGGEVAGRDARYGGVGEGICGFAGVFDDVWEGLSARDGVDARGEGGGSCGHVRRRDVE